MITTAIDRIPPNVRVLEIGAGTVKRVPHAVTLDVNPLAKPDVLHDLDVTPYPFEANAFDVVIAEHVLEHVEHVVRVVEELHRIVAPGGVLMVEVPHFSSANFHTDPTHRHAFSTRSFDYFVEGKTLARYRYSNAFLGKREALIGFEGRSVIQRAIGVRLRRCLGFLGHEPGGVTQPLGPLRGLYAGVFRIAGVA